MQINIMVTRFNNETWSENKAWREKHDFKGCIYNSSINLKNNIPIMSDVYIIEMNNQENRIEGIGKIKNKIFVDRRYKIYSDNNYNRYTYKGKKRIDRESILDTESILDRESTSTLEKLEQMLFKGKAHLKRGQGISKIPYLKINEFQEFIVNLL